jgi:hypothetical protein
LTIVLVLVKRSLCSTDLRSSNFSNLFAGMPGSSSTKKSTLSQM